MLKQQQQTNPVDSTIITGIFLRSVNDQKLPPKLGLLAGWHTETCLKAGSHKK